MKQGRSTVSIRGLTAGDGVGIPAPQALVTPEIIADQSAGQTAALMAAFFNIGSKVAEGQFDKSLEKRTKDVSAQGTKDARQAYESGVTSVSPEITKEYKGTYADAYSSTLGSLKAAGAVTKFAAYATANDLQNHEISGAIKEYNKTEFGGGTGNLNFDVEYQKVWTNSTQELVHKSTVAAAQKIKDTARISVNKSITNFSLEKTPSHAQLMDQVSNVRSVYRGYTEGQAISHVFGLYQFQATQSLNGAHKYLAMLDQPIIPDNSKPIAPDSPTPTTSFSKLFPREAVALREKTFNTLTTLKTASGQQELAGVAHYIGTLSTNIQEINNSGDINDMTAKFVAADSMIARLEGTQGADLNGVNKARAALSKAKVELNTLLKGYSTVSRLATGSIEGRGDALEDHRGMKTEEKKKALRVFLGTGDLSDVNYFGKFTSAFRNLNGLEQETPGPFLDIIREQFSSGDRNKMAGVVAFAKTLDRDGSIGEAAFKNDSENRILYDQARVVGIEAALSFQGDEEYMASLEASAKAKGDLGLVLYPDENKKKAGEKLTAFYASVGQDLDNQTTFLFSGKPLSQNFKDEINKVAPILKARLEAGGKSVSEDQIKSAVVEYFLPRTLVGEETVMLGLPDSQRVYAGIGPTGSRSMPLEYNRGFDPKFENAHIATYAQPSDGSDPQDTYENMRESVKNTRISGVDGDGLSVTVGTGARTGFGVIRSSKSFGAPVVFNAGQVLKEPRGPVVRFGRSPRNVDYVKEYTFTGDYSKDQAFVKEAFGSEYQLLPLQGGSYQLVILPFFKDIEPMEDRGEAPLSGQALRRETLKSISGPPIQLVPPRGTQAGEGSAP